MWCLQDQHTRRNNNILAAQIQMRCKIRSFTPFRGKHRNKKRNRNGHVCIHYGICYGTGEDNGLKQKSSHNEIRYDHLPWYEIM